MKRGNNYSGARWAFSDRSKTEKKQPASGGLSIMGGSNRPTTVHRGTVQRDAETLCAYCGAKGHGHEFHEPTCRSCKAATATLDITGTDVRGPLCVRCADLLGIPPAYRQRRA